MQNLFENRFESSRARRPGKWHFPLTLFIALTAVSAQSTVLHCDLHYKHALKQGKLNTVNLVLTSVKHSEK